MKATFIPNETLANLAKQSAPGMCYSLGNYPPGSRVFLGDNGVVIEEPSDGDLTVTVGETVDEDAFLDGPVFMGSVKPLRVLMDL